MALEPDARQVGTAPGVPELTETIPMSLSTGNPRSLANSIPIPTLNPCQLQCAGAPGVPAVALPRRPLWFEVVTNRVLLFIYLNICVLCSGSKRFFKSYRTP